MTFRAWCLWVVLLASTTACASRVAHGTIVGLGVATSGLHRENQQAYTAATDVIGATNRAAGGTAADYDRMTAETTAAFLARGAAIRSLAAALYAAAGINDAVRGGVSVEHMRAPARDILTSLQSALGVLGSGVLLPPIHAPPEVAAAITFLQTLVGGAP